MPTLDVLIIGAGQAGLALGYHLQHTALRFQLVERHEQIGASWRARYDSLVLFTPRCYSALPGLPLAGDPEGYPSKDEVAEYLATYVRHFHLPVVTGQGIQALERQNGDYRATTQDGALIEARAVVLATGRFRRRRSPAWPVSYLAKWSSSRRRRTRMPGKCLPAPSWSSGMGPPGATWPTS
jgi:putative flavoprotein involved in K+ transport